MSEQAEIQESQPSPRSERRIDPRSGLVYIKVSEAGSIVTIRPNGSRDQISVSYGTWITWERA